jgi:uncharacterized protein (DUF1800 family)
VSDRLHPNENYARELMELHTLGVEGGYTQADVMALARCLTGWTVKEHWWRGEFMFDPAKHDEGEKVVLGQRVAPAGQTEAEAVIDRLAEHPSTARFVAGKLAGRFLGPAASAELVTRAAAAFTLRAVLRVLLLDGLAAGQAGPLKYKRPANFMLSALRQLNAGTDAGPPVLEYLARMGQLPFAWPTPDGYPDRAEAWQGNLMPRWQFALALAQGEIEGVALDLPALLAAADAHSPARIADQLGRLLLGAPLPASHRDELLNTLKDAGEHLPRVLAAGLLAAPRFQYR